MQNCNNCGYGFHNESQADNVRTFYVCPRCGKALLTPIKVGRQTEDSPTEEGLPYKTLIEHDFVRRKKHDH